MIVWRLMETYMPALFISELQPHSPVGTICQGKHYKTTPSLPLKGSFHILQLQLLCVALHINFMQNYYSQKIIQHVLRVLQYCCYYTQHETDMCMNWFSQKYKCAFFPLLLEPFNWHLHCELVIIVQVRLTLLALRFVLCYDIKFADHDSTCTCDNMSSTVYSCRIFTTT